MYIGVRTNDYFTFKKPLMKKYYNVTLSTLLLFLLSFNLYGQRVPIVCLSADIDLIIEDVVWKADVSDLASFHANQNDTPFPTHLNEVPIPESFHMVVLGYYTPVTGASTYTFDISVALTAKPIIFVVNNSANDGFWEFIIDENGYVEGIVIRSGYGGAGVASTAAVMGRQGDEGLNLDICIDINTTNRTGILNGAVCDLGDESYSFCNPLFGTSNKDSQDVNIVPDIYPNPVQHNLFIETKDIDIQQVELLTLQGQILNQISIRYGADNIQVNTSSLVSGIYLLKLHADNQTIVEKIVVQ